jgi:hypothetical protein
MEIYTWGHRYCLRLTPPLQHRGRGPASIRSHQQRTGKGESIRSSQRQRRTGKGEPPSPQQETGEGHPIPSSIPNPERQTGQGHPIPNPQHPTGKGQPTYSPQQETGRKEFIPSPRRRRRPLATPHSARGAFSFLRRAPRRPSAAPPRLLPARRPRPPHRYPTPRRARGARVLVASADIERSPHWYLMTSRAPGALLASAGRPPKSFHPSPAWLWMW